MNVYESKCVNSVLNFFFLFLFRKLQKIAINFSIKCRHPGYIIKFAFVNTGGKI